MALRKVILEMARRQVGHSRGRPTTALALQRSLVVVWPLHKTHRTATSYFKHEGEMDGSRQEQNCVLSFPDIMCVVQMFAEWFLLSDPYRTAAWGS